MEEYSHFIHLTCGTSHNTLSIFDISPSPNHTKRLPRSKNKQQLKYYSAHSFSFIRVKTSKIYLDYVSSANITSIDSAQPQWDNNAALQGLNDRLNREQHFTVSWIVCPFFMLLFNVSVEKSNMKVWQNQWQYWPLTENLTIVRCAIYRTVVLVCMIMLPL